MTGNRKGILRRYLEFARPYRWTLALVVAAGVAKFSLPLIPAYLSRLMIDDVIRNTGEATLGGRQRLLWWIGAAWAGVLLLEMVAIYLRGYYTVKASSGVAFDIRQALWRHLQRLSLSFHHSRPTGKIVSRLMSDISVAQQMIRGGILNTLIDLGAGAIALAVLFSISWQLTLLLLAVLPLYGVLYRRMNPRLREASHDVQEQTSVMSGTAFERLSGIAVVQSFAQEKAEDRYFASQGEDLRGKAVRRGRLNTIIQSLSDLLVGLCTITVWMVGGWMAVRGDLTAGQIVQFLGTMALLLLPIRRFSEINVIYQMSMAAIERVFAIFDITPELAVKQDALAETPQVGRLEVEDVWFRYSPDGPDVLRGLTFTVEPGERVAIVGESGAGKSTLVTLIPRLYDVTAGAIRIDGTDIREYRLRRLRRGIGIVLQDSILFSGSIRENLRYGRKDATEQEMIDAAKAANAHRFIVELSEGYDAEIGERGVSLSGGQRQRISLARTILQNPRLLILDEATSSLDSESENLITEALQRVMAGRTCLIIAHRLSTIIGADRILVLREGRLVEQGPHEDLLAAGGYYRYLFEQQFGPLQELLSRTKSDPQ